MTTAEHIQRAAELVDQAIQELNGAVEISPDWAVQALRLGRGELVLARRRLLNAAKVVGGGARASV